MKNWICIHCGTTIISKCPGHRNEFYSFHVGMVKSVVTIDRVDYNKDNLSELFISYTAGSDISTPQQFRNLVELLTTENTIDAMACDHHWVMNSETEHECVLGHEHSNLKDVERIKTEIATNRQERSLQSVVSDFARVACTPIDLARRAVNLSKSTYDSFIEDQFRILKEDTRKAMVKLSAGGYSRPLFRVLTSKGSRWDDDSTWAYFDTEEDVVAFARGMNRHVDIEKLNTTDDSGYQSVEYDLNTTCLYCGKLNLPEGGIIVKLPGGEAHLACVNRKKLDETVKTRRARFNVHKKIYLEYAECENIRRSLDLKCLDSWVDEDRRVTHVYVTAEATKADMEIIIDQLKHQVFV